MSNTKLMINIFGPSTAGKSTIAEMLQEHIERLYTVDFDAVKRQIAGYYWKRDRAVATEITHDTLASVANTELPILVLLPTRGDEQSYDRIASTASNHGRILLNIEITAPNEVLIERYKDRLRKIKESGTNWKFKTLDEFIDFIKTPYYRPEDTHSFNSATNTPDQILTQILKLI